jgi:hypothetical protein
MGRGFGVDVLSINGVNGIGIAEGAILVTTEFYHPDQDIIPDALGEDTSFEGLPIVVRNMGPIVTPELEGYAMTQRGQAGVVQSGAVIKGRESGIFDVLVDAQGSKYAVCSTAS